MLMASCLELLAANEIAALTLIIRCICVFMLIPGELVEFVPRCQKVEILQIFGMVSEETLAGSSSEPAAIVYIQILKSGGIIVIIGGKFIYCTIYRDNDKIYAMVNGSF